MTWMQVSKVCSQIKPKVSVPWHWNSLKEATMLLLKNCFRSVTCCFNTVCCIYVKSSQQLTI